MAVSQFEKFCKEKDIAIEILETPESTRTAAEAAEVHGVPVAAIVKSILTKVDDTFVLFLVPGDKRLDFERVKQEMSAAAIRLATPDEVKSVTGYSIGGVPPFGHTQPIMTKIEEGFPQGIVIPAAGSHQACFKIEFSQLKEIISQVS